MEKYNSIQFESNPRDITSHVLIDLYKTMLRIRRVQLKIEAEYPKDEMKTPVHLCLGQEAIPAGVCAHLEKEDYVFSNYRGHGHYLAKGGNLKALIAELYGRTTGCSGSRGGSMHIIDTSAGFLGTSSIVAGSIPIATGAALGFLLEGRANVSCVFFGDGAVDEGVLYESINFAMLKKLPVIYICENNFYAVCSAQKNRQALDNIHQRFAGCGIPGYRADGNNVVEVWRTAKEAIENARNGGGPSLIEFRTYRWRGHSGGDNDVSLGYRTQEELDEWMNKCPLKNFEQFLRAENLITEEEIRDMEIAIDREIEEAFTFAQASPLPDEKDLLKHLYKDGK